MSREPDGATEPTGPLTLQAVLTLRFALVDRDSCSRSCSCCNLARQNETFLGSGPPARVLPPGVPRTSSMPLHRAPCLTARPCALRRAACAVRFLLAAATGASIKWVKL